VAELAAAFRHSRVAETTGITRKSGHVPSLTEYLAAFQGELLPVQEHSLGLLPGCYARFVLVLAFLAKALFDVPTTRVLIWVSAVREDAAAPQVCWNATFVANPARCGTKTGTGASTTS